MSVGEKVSTAPRYHVRRMHVVYDTGDEFWSGPVVDVSESGIFVETTHDLPVGCRVTVFPDVAGDDRLPFDLHAQVVRYNEYDLDEYFDRTPGLAFVWIDLADNERVLVRDFLKSDGVLVRDQEMVSPPTNREPVRSSFGRSDNQ